MTRLSSSACVALLLGADGLILAMLGRTFQFSVFSEAALMALSVGALLWACLKAWRHPSDVAQAEGQAEEAAWPAPSRLQEPAQGV